MIRLVKVNKYFNHHKKNQIHVINNTSIEFASSGLVALLGPSGCGKTTLLNAIGGLDKVNRGQIYINGKKITRKTANRVDKIRNLNVGYIFQDFHLINDLSVFDNVALVLKMIGIKDKEEIKKRVDYVLETVGIYRYRKRLAGMLSGGERQRVGIARAIVKNPDIILADEPTGNLDSKNTIEIMNIIKSISKDKLVLLVTHEKDIAYFYSSRIIEIKDGIIENDLINDHQNDLDYQIENKIYLKDLKNNSQINNENLSINYFGNNQEAINIDVVVVNNNIYIKSNSVEKVEVIDNNSNIELIDGSYKKITKKDYEEYIFDLNKLDNGKYKKKYSSIYNPISMIIQGLKKVRDYSFLKKLLLVGFFVSGMFVLYAISNIYGVTDVKDKDFININKNYLMIKANEIKVDDYLEYEKNESVSYMLPSSSMISFSINYNNYYQTVYATDTLSGSLSDIEMINNNDLILGRMPQKINEIVVDKLIIDQMFKTYIAAQVGINNYEKLLNIKLEMNNLDDFILVGITDFSEPNIYAEKSLFINLIANSNAYYGGNKDFNFDQPRVMYSDKEMVPGLPNEQQQVIYDYDLFKDQIELKKGKLPINDYQIIVNYNERYAMPLNKKIETKVNDLKLTVVGYYTSAKEMNYMLSNNNTVKYDLITKTKEISFMPKDYELALNNFRGKNLNIEEPYKEARRSYIDQKSKNVSSTITLAIIILAISFIEIFLIIRSSFLSRIKEVGTLRAIGMKKRDIYKMFLGEIIAITSIASILGIGFMIFIIDRLMTVSFLAKQFMLNYQIVLLSIILVFGFNIIVGLVPVFNTIRKSPAQILSRTDVD